MKRRKMFLATLLIILIVFQSVLPFTTVNATTNLDVEITSSSELYTALVKELVAKNINAYYDPANFKIITSQAEIDKVTELDLSNAGIDDLTGLGNFNKVTKLNLTSNELTVDSNLAELDKLPLSSLNLSSNELESINSITSFDDIEYTDITNQKIEKRDVIELDVSEKASNVQTVNIDLPDILLEDNGEINAEWLEAEAVSGYAHVNWAKFNPRGTTCELVVASGNGDSYYPYKGLLKITVKVEDSSSKLYNTDITLYYVITDSEETGICFDDDNLYKAVKEQLTAGQYENGELASYGEEGITLYQAAYDDAKILVIDTNVVINDIPSLILNDKRITDLRGLEEFIGLESNLNLSYNYIDSLERVIELETNKEKEEAELLAKYKEALSALRTNRTALITAEEKVKELDEKIKEVRKQIDELDDTAADYEQKVNSLLDLLNNTKTGYVVLKAEETRKVEMYRKLVSEGLDELYSIYEKEYRLTTLLPLSVYDLSSEDLALANYDQAKAYANAIIEKVSKLEQNGALTSNEKELLLTAFNIPTETEVEQEDAEGNKTTTTVQIENPISEYLKEFQAFEDYNSISDYKNFVESFKYIDVVTTAMNYCLIERMNDIDLTECLFEEGLIELYDYCLEYGMDTSYINEIVVWLNEIPAEEEVVTEETPEEPEVEPVEVVEYNLVDDGVVTASEAVLVYRDLTCDGAYVKDVALEKQLAGHFTSTTDEELAKFIVLPRIKYLNMTDNKLETLAGIEVLDNLLGLYMYKNLLGDINDVDWTKLTSLMYLNLGYNQLSDIDALEVLRNLRTLNVSTNLLSGNFDFYLAGMEYLQEVDFSRNQYNNISYLVSQYTFIAKNENYDNVGDYLTNSPSAPIISFQYQTLSMKATIVKESALTTFELPKIFEQAEELDHLRTSFGETSLNGTVVADGTQVLLRTPDVGDYKACVVIDGHNGNYYTEDGIAFGTTCTIDYTVVEETLVVPEDPETPVDPEDPETPVDPEDPETPVDPEDPETPVDPEDPETPVDPEDPETPVDPEDPETPVDPEDPEDPETPVDPEDPETPVDPEDPETPVDPEDPETPTEPEIEYGYTVNDTMVVVNTPEITVKEFKEKLVSDEYIVTVLNENREVVTDTTILRTGYVVSIDKDGDNLENLEVIVKGDVNGDGEVDALDTGIVRQYINATRDLVGVYAAAADVNSDGEIDSLDSLQILKYRAAKINAFEE